MSLRAPVDGICQIRIEGPPDHVPRDAKTCAFSVPDQYYAETGMESVF